MISTRSAILSVDSLGNQGQSVDGGTGKGRKSTQDVQNVPIKVGLDTSEKILEPGESLRRLGKALIDFGRELSFVHMSDSTP
jgi:hypothetical protein